MQDNFYAVSDAGMLITEYFVNQSLRSVPALFRKKADAHRFMMQARERIKELGLTTRKLRDVKVIKVELIA
jgi:hypothetical protein